MNNRKIMYIVLPAILCLLLFSGCKSSKTLAVASAAPNITSSVSASPTPTASSSASASVTPTPTAQFVSQNINTKFEAYLKDVEEQTHRKISDEQRNLLYDYISKNPIKQLPPSENKIRRHKFDQVRKKLITEWAQHTGQKWPTYAENVLSKNGKVDRKKGSNYDAHHIIELSNGGPNKWWNMHPAAFPNEHQQGIHRKGGPASKLF